MLFGLGALDSPLVLTLVPRFVLLPVCMFAFSWVKPEAFTTAEPVSSVSANMFAADMISSSTSGDFLSDWVSEFELEELATCVRCLYSASSSTTVSSILLNTISATSEGVF